MPPITTSAGALAALTSAQGSALSPEAAMDQANQQAGVPQAQQQVSGLRGALQNTTNLLGQVAPSVYGRTGNSLVTDAQASKIIGNEQAPLNEQLNRENTDYGNAEQDFQNDSTTAAQRASAILGGQQNNISNYSDLYKSLLGDEENKASLAEQAREFNATPHGSTSDGGLSLGGLAGLLGGGSGGTTGSGVSRDNSGGFQFTLNGKPATAAAYIQSQGGNFNDLTQLLAGSKNPGDAQVIKDMTSGMSQQHLEQKYPYIFGGI